MPIRLRTMSHSAANRVLMTHDVCASVQPEVFLSSCAQQVLVLLEPCFASAQASVVDLLAGMLARLHSMFPIARGEATMPPEALVRCQCACVSFCKDPLNAMMLSAA